MSENVWNALADLASYVTRHGEEGGAELMQRIAQHKEADGQAGDTDSPTIAGVPQNDSETQGDATQGQVSPESASAQDRPEGATEQSTATPPLGASFSQQAPREAQAAGEGSSAPSITEATHTGEQVPPASDPNADVQPDAGARGTSTSDA